MQSNFFAKPDLQTANANFVESLRVLMELTSKIPTNSDPLDPILSQSLLIANEVNHSLVLSALINPTWTAPNKSSTVDKDVSIMLPAQLLQSLNLNPLSQQQLQQQQSPSIPLETTSNSQQTVDTSIDNYSAYEKYERIAKQDLIQHLKSPIQYKESNQVGSTDYNYQVLDPDGNLLGEHKGTKKRAKTFAAIKACRNKSILPLVIPSKRQYWLDTYFPLESHDIPITDNEDHDDYDPESLAARNKLYSFYNRTFNTVPRYEFTQDSNLFYYCDLYIMDILKAKGEGRSKKIAANNAALKVLKNEKIV